MKHAFLHTSYKCSAVTCPHIDDLILGLHGFSFTHRMQTKVRPQSENGQGDDCSQKLRMALFVGGLAVGGAVVGALATPVVVPRTLSELLSSAGVLGVPASPATLRIWCGHMILIISSLG